MKKIGILVTVLLLFLLLSTQLTLAQEQILIEAKVLDKRFGDEQVLDRGGGCCYNPVEYDVLILKSSREEILPAGAKISFFYKTPIYPIKGDKIQATIAYKNGSRIKGINNSIVDLGEGWYLDGKFTTNLSKNDYLIISKMVFLLFITSIPLFVTWNKKRKIASFGMIYGAIGGYVGGLVSYLVAMSHGPIPSGFYIFFIIFGLPFLSWNVITALISDQQTLHHLKVTLGAPRSIEWLPFILINIVLWGSITSLVFTLKEKIKNLKTKK